MAVASSMQESSWQIESPCVSLRSWGNPAKNFGEKPPERCCAPSGRVLLPVPLVDQLDDLHVFVQVYVYDRLDVLVDVVPNNEK